MSVCIYFFHYRSPEWLISSQPAAGIWTNPEVQPSQPRRGKQGEAHGLLHSPPSVPSGSSPATAPLLPNSTLFFPILFIVVCLLDLGSGIGNIRIRDKHTGSATLIVRYLFGIEHCGVRIQIRFCCNGSWSPAWSKKLSGVFGFSALLCFFYISVCERRVNDFKTKFYVGTGTKANLVCPE